MPTLRDVLSPEYGYVLIMAAILVLENLFLGSRVMGLRKKFFTSPEFNKSAKDLLDEHKKTFPNAPFAMGYPDMGNGRYADKLTYEQWYQFNNAQRGHLNYLESVWGVMSLLVVGGAFEPKVYASLALVYALSRALYAIGYSSKGPQGREAGAIAGALSMVGMVFYSFYLGAGLLKAK